MKLYDILKWDPEEASVNDIICYKHEAEDFNTHTQLIVHQSQEAIFFKDGRALDLFGPGRHTLSSENIPLLKKFINLPTNGESPFHCEVYFVNKVFQMEMKWGTPSPVQTEDPIYGVVINVGASGSFAAQIADSRKFITKIVGTRANFTRTELIQFLRTVIVTNIKDKISEIVNRKKISFLQAQTEVKSLSEEVHNELIPVFADYGIDLVRFDWSTIYVPPEDLKPLKEAKNNAAKRAIEGYTYQQEKGFDVMRTAAGNQGMAGSMMGVGMGMGMGMGMGVPMGTGFGNIAQNTLGQMNAQPAQQPAQAQPEQAATVKCPKCGASVNANAKFCPECGNKMENVKKFCPECGKEVSPTAKFCPECGTKLG